MKGSSPLKVCDVTSGICTSQNSPSGGGTIVEIMENDVRRVLLEVVASYENSGGQFQQFTVLQSAQSKLTALGIRDEQTLLTAWYDLFREGLLSWGLNLANPDPPFCHSTRRGRETLAQVGRDPSNRAGYVKYLQDKSRLNAVAASYVEEALLSYTATCYRATCVLVGAACESLVFELRDAVLAKVKPSGNSTKELGDWRTKVVAEGLQLYFENALSKSELRERFDAHWGSFIGQIRISRNEAGHPKNIASFTADIAHANLLIFPELASLCTDLLNQIA